MFDARHHKQSLEQLLPRSTRDNSSRSNAETPAVVVVALPPADPAGMNSLAVPPPDRGGVSSPPALLPPGDRRGVSSPPALLPPGDRGGVSISSPMVMMSTKRTAVDAMPPVGGVVLDVFVMKV